MMRGMYAAISGLQAHQTMLDVTANNLANVDTTGYKAQRTSFVDELSQLVRPATTPNTATGGENPTQVGLGVQLGSIDNLMSQGSAQTTGNPTDVMIQGDGFLRVGTGTPGAAGFPAGVQYTRAGNLQINPQGYLTTSSGQYILGYQPAAGGGPNAANNKTAIQLPAGASDVAIGQDGSVSYIDATTQQRATAGYISLASFANEAGLERQGGSDWTVSAASGAEQVGQPGTAQFGTTIAGELEASNVDLATEFTNMITAERGYQAQSRVITTSDQMLQTVVQMGQ
jgi:flagellar hook protein FlgE